MWFGFFPQENLLIAKLQEHSAINDFMYCKVKCLFWSVRLPATARSAWEQICHSLFMGCEGNEIILWIELEGRIEIIYIN